MSRLALLTLMVAPAVAPAQGFSLPYRTGSSFYQPSFGRHTGGFYGAFSPVMRLPAAVPYGGVGYLSPGGFYDPGFYTTVGPNVYFIPSFAGEVARPLVLTQPPQLVGAGVPSPQLAQPLSPSATGGQSAQLRLDLPAVADLWVDGKLYPSRSANYTLTSPPLSAGGRHTFAIKAAWKSADGTKYEWDRSVTVAAGGHSKVAVAAGFKAKD